jgi:hypothetical protein
LLQFPARRKVSGGKQSIGHASHRGNNDHWLPVQLTAERWQSAPRIASEPSTEVPPNFMTIIFELLPQITGEKNAPEKRKRVSDTQCSLTQFSIKFGICKPN